MKFENTGLVNLIKFLTISKDETFDILDFNIADIAAAAIVNIILG